MRYIISEFIVLCTRVPLDIPFWIVCSWTRRWGGWRSCWYTQCAWERKWKDRDCCSKMQCATRSSSVSCKRRLRATKRQGNLRWWLTSCLWLDARLATIESTRRRQSYDVESRSCVPTGGGRGGRLPPLTSDKQKKKRERKRRRRRKKEGKEGRFICLLVSSYFKQNVARHKVCAVKITAIHLEMHWLHIRNLYWRGVQTSA